MKTPSADIAQFGDIQLLVDTFYTRVQADPLLGPVFNDVIRDRWPEHLEKMYRFWQTILLEEHTYSGSPFPPHAQLPVSAAHFDRWLTLFSQAVDDLFRGAKADEAKWRSARMAEVFQHKIAYYQDRGTAPLA